ncbi:DNA polymerase IV [Pseudoroseomonas rhizosphaerae]|uniref:DNA polymerase IV n=1 Tax=Teichococcus rhizosphaerae TaxID=1335062 RepID=A0A2C7ADP2_9PROT|nr:DNA polymerase IV [Pseudoroseomonas rhizosphaerae]PHK95236.1 DNA polymerase IV [Pseudoroseomonas rhizosphaerae]
MSAGAPTAAVRKIIHVDMDAFYASVEQRDDPSLRGLPVAVGGARERGVVAAASYEARRFGVRSAMPSLTARRLCPDLVFVRPRFEVYRAVSEQVRAVFAEHTPLIEPLSLDEAYLDVTENLQRIASATEIAERIRATIRERTGLTASAGVSYNKFLAKLASDHRKPDGLFVITPRMGPGFVEALPVGRFHGIGPVTAARMNRLGIHTGLDLRQWSLEGLQAEFGKAGAFYHAIARGEDYRPVQAHRLRKSVGAETTFSRDLAEFGELREALRPLAAKVWDHVARHGLQGRTVTLKVKFSDFRQITRSQSSVVPVASLAELEGIATRLLGAVLPPPRGIRLLGVTLSALGDDSKGPAAQLALAL